MTRDIEITYSCGHTGTVTISGKEDYIEWKAKQMAQDLCPECQAKADQEFLEKVAKENKAEGMADLVGSEKQIGWAEDIRANLRQQVAEFIQQNETNKERVFQRIKDLLDADPEADVGRKRKSLDRYEAEIEIAKVLLEEFNQQTSAKWFIEHRGPFYVREEVANRFYSGGYKKSTTFVPETITHEGTVTVEIDRLSMTGEYADFFYPKDEDFREVMKADGPRWSGRAWHLEKRNAQRQHYNGFIDQVASMIAELVSNGFAVKVADPEIIKLIEMKAYTIRNPKFVGLTSRRNFWIEGAEGESAETVAQIRGAKRYPAKRSPGGGYFVPRLSAAAVEDFAAIYGFFVSDIAQREIELQKEEEVITLTPKKTKKSGGSVKDLMKGPDGVLADLRDED